jgi:uncharacterized membrane protein YfcA
MFARMILTPLSVAALALLGLGAGTLGAMVGVGGGIIVVPTLVLVFHVDIKTAIATSLVAVVATSTAAGSVYVGRGLTNMRLAMTLEIFTTVGGITGGVLAVLVSPSALAAMFGVIMGVTAVLLLQGKDPARRPGAGGSAPAVAPPLGEEHPGRLAGSYYDAHAERLIEYHAVRLPVGGAVSALAGMISGMLGVGGGFLKVPAMALGMNVPIKVAAATSNFMIGVTAIASLFIYLARGFVSPLIAAPVALGVTAGALMGTRLAGRVSARVLRRILSVIVIVVGVEMLFKALGVSLGR